ncbi:MAG: helix-hairpin-helix domain-containing protein [Clostridiales bacterium]|jgi:competence protein ComEA|nr:helix-hairpin-helix domain-containing protein [Clostridiales bacterium]
MFEKIMKRLNLKSSKVAKLLFFGAIGVAALFAVLYINEMRSTPTLLIEAELTGAQAETRGYAAEGGQVYIAAPRAIMIYISGEVYSPGVFGFYEGARIADAVEAAGGMTQYADPNAINMSARIVDEQHIVVFSLADNMPPSPQASGGAGIGADGLVNINTATSEQLQTLSGIGPVTAGNIISHREARGGFGAIEEIMNVSGIGEVTFGNIRDRITVE